MWAIGGSVDPLGWLFALALALAPVQLRRYCNLIPTSTTPALSLRLLSNIIVAF